MKKPKRSVKLIFKGKLEDFSLTDSVAYWQSRTAAERLGAVWELTKTAVQLKGGNINELRLDRTVAVIKRI